MRVPRIDEVVRLLESYVLDGITLTEGQVKAALRLLDLAIDDAPQPDGDGEEAAVLAFAPRIVADRGA